MKQKNKKENYYLIASITLSAILISGTILFGVNNELDLDKLDEALKGYQDREEARKLEGDGIKELLKIRDNDRVLGDKNAEITIFEYSDFECPYCKKFYKGTRQAVEEFKGKVNLVYRHFPGLHQPLSIVEANAAECAGEQGGDNVFYKYHDEIYKSTESNGRKLIKEPGRGIEISRLNEIAKELKLDIKKFGKCSASMKYEDKVKENMESGGKLGVTGTPSSFIVNNKSGEVRKIGGYVPFSFLKEKIKSLIK